MAHLTGFRPFAGLARRPSTLEDLLFAPGGAGASAARFAPRANLTETSDGYELELELPGVRPEEVRVTLTGDTLVVQGEKRREEQREGDAWHLTERAYGAFQRAFTFPVPVDPDGVEATSSNGVLRLRLAKAREAQPRRIEVRRGERARAREGGASGGEA